VESRYKFRNCFVIGVLSAATLGFLSQIDLNNHALYDNIKSLNSVKKLDEINSFTYKPDTSIKEDMNSNTFNLESYSSVDSFGLRN
jgi:hypothetical protein